MPGSTQKHGSSASASRLVLPGAQGPDGIDPEGALVAASKENSAPRGEGGERGPDDTRPLVLDRRD